MIRVLIVDDHSMVRQGLQKLVQSAHDMGVVGLACDGREALLFCANHSTDVVLMDVMMPEMDGFAATRFIRLLESNVKVVLFSIHSDQETIQAAQRAGADGFLSKSVSTDEILDTIRSICKDG